MGLSARWVTYLSLIMKTGLRDTIFKVKDRTGFLETALAVFNYQAEHNPVYHDFLVKLRKTRSSIKSIPDIPFLPVEFFKSHKIIIENLSTDKVFESSRTTGSVVSKHFVHDIQMYEES